ncbi:MAG TPA: hypothetical protein VJZ27_12380 [Aggregatilineales bacterium]|nr:hypothetical protein [Aggregatilineales bacterium]
MNYDDEIKDITADLVSEKRHETFITGLFLSPSGIWLDVSLVNGLEKDVKEVIQRLNTNLNDRLLVALYVFQGAAIKTANRADKTALPRKRAL